MYISPGIIIGLPPFFCSANIKAMEIKNKIAKSLIFSNILQNQIVYVFHYHSQQDDKVLYDQITTIQKCAI